MSIQDKLEQIAQKHKRYYSFDREVEEIASKEFGILREIVTEDFKKRVFFKIHQYVR